MALPDDFIIEHEGGVCPYQAEGTFGDDRFYFRYRSDNAQLSVGPAEQQPDDEWRFPMPDHPPRLYAEIFNVFGDPLRGFLDRDEAHDLMERLISMLKVPEEWVEGTHHDRLIAAVEALTKAWGDPKVAEG